MTNIAKIDFIICESGGFWRTESHNIPKNIALKSDKEIILWAKANKILDDEFFIGVYWNDPNIMEEN